MAAAAVELHDVHFRYRGGDFSLSVPELRLEAGERVAVIGPSGSGKTTLLHLMAGIALPEHGRVTTTGTEISALGDSARRAFRAQHVGLVFQEFELLEYLSVLDNILLPYRINPSLPLDGAARDRARELADRVGLAPKLARPIRRLSHGERQRVALCRALVADPALILADEPTGSLDPRSKERALELLKEFCVDATLIVATHDHALLPQFDQVVDFTELVG